MIMPTENATPEWLIPGADVVVYRIGGEPGIGAYARRDTVKTVGKAWFTLTGEHDRTRYSIVSQEANSGLTILRVVPLGSSEAHVAALRYKIDRCQRRGELAVYAWQQNRNADTLQAAIDALTTIRDLPPIPAEKNWLA
jgi:hypothetical protein